MVTEYVKDSYTNWVKDNWKSLEDINKDNKSFGFIKVPFDYNVSYRPGARFAPNEILNVFESFSLYCSDKNISFRDANLIKINKVKTNNSYKATFDSIVNVLIDLDINITPIILGGDHSITFPIVTGLQKRYDEEIGLIVFDAHFDYRKPVVGNEHSGNWLYNLKEELNFNNVCIIGVSAPIYSIEYREELEYMGTLIKSPYDIRKDGWQKVLDEIKQKMKGCNNIHISLDIDVIDQGFTKATSVPNANGLFPYEVIDSIFNLTNDLNVSSIDIVEIAPVFDDRENTASNIAAHVISNFIAGSINN